MEDEAVALGWGYFHSPHKWSWPTILKPVEQRDRAEPAEIFGENVAMSSSENRISHANMWTFTSARAQLGEVLTNIRQPDVWRILVGRWILLLSRQDKVRTGCLRGAKSTWTRRQIESRIDDLHQMRQAGISIENVERMMKAFKFPVNTSVISVEYTKFKTSSYLVT